MGDFWDPHQRPLQRGSALSGPPINMPHGALSRSGLLLRLEDASAAPHVTWHRAAEACLRCRPWQRFGDCGRELPYRTHVGTACYVRAALNERPGMVLCLRCTAAGWAPRVLPAGREVLLGRVLAGVRSGSVLWAWCDD
jgi:hypothetical protein